MNPIPLSGIQSLSAKFDSPQLTAGPAISVTSSPAGFFSAEISK